MSNSPPLVLPRGLIFLASIWLIGSWVITIGLQTPIQPVSASYTPSVRMMLLSVVVGLMIGWPLLRLSQRETPHPFGQTLLDLVVLVSLTQVVLWPLRLVTPWSIARTAAIDATLVSWLLLAGALVAAAIGSPRPGVRALAMVAAVGMCLLGPALTALGAWTGVDASVLVGLSPLMAVRTLGDGGGAQPPVEEWRWIILLGTAVALTWIVLIVALGAIRGREPGAGPAR